ncbi:hypothetical protein PT974_00294 [Cladobotryum mycophilum]|uniref:Uncharacterized protein n=1 Tax=Cladobotryum mycophilum TaxID=491253 RepID=A0ABR0T0Q6_9HYPO
MRPCHGHVHALGEAAAATASITHYEVGPQDNVLLRAKEIIGTQVCFLEIFNGDAVKCDQFNQLLCKKSWIPSLLRCLTQTYTRKVNAIISNVIASFSTTAQKIIGSIGHLAGWKEMAIREGPDSNQAASVVKNEGKPNDPVTRIKATVYLRHIWDELDDMSSELYIGRKCSNCRAFLRRA